MINNYKEKMPQIFSAVSKALKKLDLFPTSSFIRYNGQDSYTTVTGGFTSFLIIVVFIALFARMGVLTVNQEIIQSSASVFNEVDPPPLKVVTSPNNDFMFSIMLYGFDLTNPAFRLFNVTLWQNFYSPGFVPINQTQVPLAACTLQHFAFNSDIEDIFHKFQMQKALCPPIGYQFSVGGKTTSEVSSLFTVLVQECDSAIDPACASTATLSSILSSINGEFTLVIPIVNTELNPADSTYKTIYLQDRNFFSFNLNQGVKGTGSIEQASVQTDVSIMPFENIVEQQFIKMANLINGVPYLMTAYRPYAQISFNKASFTTTYTRNFNKVDTYFSYVGGLIGTIIGLMFILNSYSQKAYEISIAHKLFKYDGQEQIKSNEFNLLYFFAMTIKGIFQVFKCKLNWPKTQKFINCSDEINLQLDITYLIRKIMFLESAVQLLFKQNQFQALYLMEKPTISMAMGQRRKLFTSQILKDQNQPHPLQQNKTDNPINQFQENIDRNNLNCSQNQIHQECLQKDSSINGLTFTKRSKIGQNVQTTLIHVIQDCKNGDSLSRKILQKVDNSLRSQIQKSQQNVKNKGDQSFQPIQLQEEILQKNKEMQTKYKKIEGFDFQVQK